LKRLNRRRVAIIALAWCVFSTLYICSGSSRALDLNDLYNSADFIVKGTVVDVNTSEDFNYYYLDARIEVEKCIKSPNDGIAPSTHITVRSSEVKIPEGVAYEHPELVNFSVGEKVIVYLESVSSELLTPIGERQGKFTLIGNSYVNYSGLIYQEPRPYSYLILGLVIAGVISSIIVYWFRYIKFHQVAIAY